LAGWTGEESREGEEGEGMGFLLAISSSFPVDPVLPVILSDFYKKGKKEGWSA
jgi:hypothetical protein